MPDQEPTPPPASPPANPEPGVGTIEPEAKRRRRTAPGRKNKPGQLPPFNVVLLDDDEHSYEYVIEMLKAIFAYPLEKGFQLAREVDARGRVIVLTTHKEKAELKCEQIQAYGADYRNASCKGSMSALIEPAAG